MIKGNPYVKNGWLRCPACKRKLFPVRPDTKIRCLLWVCRQCHEQFEINLEPRACEP